MHSSSLPRYAGDLHGVAFAVERLRKQAGRSRRLVYEDECGHVVKIALTRATEVDARRNTLMVESVILDCLHDVDQVPKVECIVECEGEFAALVMELFEGEPLSTVQSVSPLVKISLLVQLTALCHRLSLRGVCHGDIRPQNILLDSKGRLFLLDFDQALSGLRYWQAMWLNTVGSAGFGDEMTVHGSIRTIGRSLSKRWSLRHQRQMPSGRRVTTPAGRLLRHAWTIAIDSDANAPGDRVAYYSFDHEGLHFGGERSWADRWRVLSQIADYEGRRVLELGCNMGLLSSFLLKHGKAASVLGIDHDLEIVASAKLVGSALGVSPELQVKDLEQRGVGQELLSFKPDIVFCLNVWNWVSWKGELEEILHAAPEVVYEGHDSVDVEKERLEAFGLRVDVVTTTERGRPLLHGVRG
jgi:predicted Ser/Thr protein kinase/SAM-dependent methyltransferase